MLRLQSALHRSAPVVRALAPSDTMAPAVSAPPAAERAPFWVYLAGSAVAFVAISALFGGAIFGGVGYVQHRRTARFARTPAGERIRRGREGLRGVRVRETSYAPRALPDSRRNLSLVR